MSLTTTEAPAEAGARFVQPQRGRAGERITAAAIIAVLIVIFLWNPLTSGRSIVPGGNGQLMPLMHVPTVEPPDTNSQLFDPLLIIYPWFEWNRHEIAAGRLPLWNPYNGSGVPHLANGESAIFSPFTWPFLVLTLDAAAVVTAALRLFVAGFATYLFLRRVRVGHLGALVGGVAYTFASYNVIWLQWTASAASALLPLLLLCADMVVNPSSARGRRWGIAALAGTIAWSLFAGHPETAFFSLALTGLYALARVAVRRSRRAVLAGIGAISAAGVLGLLVASIQVLPFLEYLQHGARSGADGNQLFYPSGLLSLVVFPLVLGSPMQQYRHPELGRLTFSAVGIGSVGLAVLFAAIVGAVSYLWTRRRLALFFTAVSLTWFVFAYDVAGITGWVTSLPGLRELLIIRSNAVMLFGASALAALGVDAVADRAARVRGRKLTAAVVGGAVALVVVSLGAVAFTFNEYPSPHGFGEIARATARDHILFVLVTFGIAVAAIVLLTAANGRTLRALAGAGLVAAVFLQGGYLFRSWNPTVEHRFVYARSDTLEAIADRVGDEQTLYVGAGALIADVNLQYRLRSPANYDVIDVDVYAKLYRKVLRPPEPGRSGGAILETLGGPVRPDGIGGLRAMGIRYVVSGRTDGLQLDGLEHVGDFGPFAVSRVPGSPPRYFSPASVVGIADGAAALRAASRPDFAPIERSVVEARPGAVGVGESSERGRVEVRSETPTSTHVRVSRSTPGWLIAQQSAAPGWHATIDGRDVAIRTGNAAFLAVPVGAGTHEVVLRYRPTSVVLGAWISAGALVVILLVSLGGWYVDRRRRSASADEARVSGLSRSG